MLSPQSALTNDPEGIARLGSVCVFKSIPLLGIAAPFDDITSRLFMSHAEKNDGGLSSFNQNLDRVIEAVCIISTRPAGLFSILRSVESLQRFH